MWLSTLILSIFLFFSSSVWSQINPNPNPTNPNTPGTTPTTGFIIQGLLESSLSATDGFQQPNSTLINIYGGAAGALTGTASGQCGVATLGDSTCNNCVDASSIPCNTRRIHRNGYLTISFTSTSGQLGLGQVVVQLANQSGANPVTITGLKGTTGPGANLAGSVSIPWSEICENIGGADESAANIDFGTGTSTRTDDCLGDYNASGRLILGIDQGQNGATGDNDLNGANDLVQNQYQIIIHYRGKTTDSANANFCTGSVDGAGACNFTVVPGDSKVFVDDVNAVTSFSQRDFRAVRIFYAARSPSSPNTPTDPDVDSPSKDLAIALNSSATNGLVQLQNNIVDGLNNGSTYDFRIATLDIANNLGYFRNLQPVNTCFVATDDDCHTATPDEVIALTEKEFDCFIATAAYGSPLESHVATFRQFRNKILHASPWGRWLIKKYYQYSPPWAEFIAKRPQVKQLVRLLLTPLWFIATVSVYYSGYLMTFLMSLLLIILFRRRWRRA